MGRFHIRQNRWWRSSAVGRTAIRTARQISAPSFATFASARCGPARSTKMPDENPAVARQFSISRAIYVQSTCNCISDIANDRIIARISRWYPRYDNVVDVTSHGVARCEALHSL
jgi:hypothetical protein